MSSGSPSSQAAKPGEASRLFSRIASSKRSFGGKNDSRSITPTCVERRRLDLLDQRRQVEVAARAARRASRSVATAGCARGCGSGRRRCRAAPSRPVAVPLDALARAARRPRASAGGGAANELEDRDRHAGAAAGRVDREVGRVAQPLDARRRPGPSRPGPSSRARPVAAANSSGVMPLRAGVVFVRPTARKSSARSSGNVSSRLPRSPLGSMTIAGMPSIAASSSSAEAQARLAAAGHADADGVRDQVLASRTAAARRGSGRSRDRTAGRDRTSRASRTRPLTVRWEPWRQTCRYRMSVRRPEPESRLVHSWSGTESSQYRFRSAITRLA